MGPGASTGGPDEIAGPDKNPDEMGPGRPKKLVPGPPDEIGPERIGPGPIGPPSGDAKAKEAMHNKGKQVMT
jgi:hypothetical protein